MFLIKVIVNLVIQVMIVTMIVEKMIGIKKIKSVLVDVMTTRYISSISLTTIMI